MSLLRYPGTKSKISKKILERIDFDFGPDMEYREPFLGSGSVLIQALKSKTIHNVWINDKDPGIAALWNAIIHSPISLKEKVMNYHPEPEDFYAMKDYIKSLDAIPYYSSDALDLGFKKLAIHQISYSGLGTLSGSPIGGRNQTGEYKVGCRWSPDHICKTIDEYHALLSQVHIRENRCTSLDFSAVIGDNSNRAVIYLDPPYYQVGDTLYQLGFEKSNHTRLFNLLNQSPHMWLLSYDNCDKILDLYAQYTIEKIPIRYDIVTKKDQKNPVKMELLINNYYVK